MEHIEQREIEVTDLLEVCNGIRDLFGYDRDDGIDLVTYATVDYSKLRNALHEVFLKYPVDWSKETNAIMEELFALHPKETPPCRN